MGRHRRRRGRRPTIVIPGSSQLPRRPAVTAVVVAGTLAVTPGMLQMGTGDMSPLEGSARLTPPTNALGVPSLSDYDEEGRLVLEAAPGAIQTVTAVQLTSEPITVSPVVANAVAATLEQMQPRPLEAAMSFGPADVETVKIDELGIPVAADLPGAGTSGGLADLLGLAPVGEEAVPGPEAGGGTEVGPALGEDRSGPAAGGTAALGTGAAGAGGPEADRGDSSAPGIVAAPYSRDSAQGPAAGGSATDGPEGSGVAPPCPVEESLSGGSGNEGPERGGREVVEGGNEGPAVTPIDRDVRELPSNSDREVDSGNLPDYVGPVLDSGDDHISAPAPDDSVDRSDPDPVVVDSGSGNGDSRPDPARPSVPSVPNEVTDDESAVDRPVHSTPGDDGGSVPELPDPVAGGGDSDSPDPEPDPVVWEDGPDRDKGKGNDKPWDDVEEPVDEPPVEELPDPVEENPDQGDEEPDPGTDGGGAVDPVSDPEPVEEEPTEPVEVEVPDEVDEPAEDVSEPVVDEEPEPVEEDEPEVDDEPVVVVDYEEDEPTEPEETETDADPSDDAGEDDSAEPSESSDEESEGSSESDSSDSVSEDAPESSSDDSGDGAGSSDESERDDPGTESSESDSGSSDSGSSGSDSGNDSGGSDSGEDS